MAFASIKKSYTIFYNTILTLICSLFSFAKSKNRTENELKDVSNRHQVKRVKVQNQPRRTKNARPTAGRSNKKLILVEMKKEKCLLVQQLYKISSENEQMKNRLEHLENSRDSNATVAEVSDLCAYAKLYEKLDGFIEKFSQTTPTNDDKIDSTTRDGKYNDNVAYEKFDKKFEKLQMTMNAFLADKESMVRLNTKTNREMNDLKSRMDIFERNGHVEMIPDNDFDSLKSDLDRMKNEMQFLKGNISKNKSNNGDADKLTRKYDKLKMRFDFIEKDVAHNAMCIHRSQQSLQKVVNIMTAANQRNAYGPQQPIYVDRSLREPVVYSNPPQEVCPVPEPPVIPTRPPSVTPTYHSSPPPPPPMKSTPPPPPPPPPPPMNSTPTPAPKPPTGTQRVYERIAITADALNAVSLKKPDGKPNKIKLRSDIVIVKKKPENPPDL